MSQPGEYAPIQMGFRYVIENHEGGPNLVEGKLANAAPSTVPGWHCEKVVQALHGIINCAGQTEPEVRRRLAGDAFFASTKFI